MNKEGRNKKAQVTIFVILAILIVLGFLIYFLVYPKIKTNSNVSIDNPHAYIENCIKEDLDNLTRVVSLQGGSLNPSAYSFYNGTRIQYVCYTDEYYRPCVIQKPLLQETIKKIIEDSIKSKVNQCFTNLKNDYEKRGYTVQLNKGAKEINIDILPRRIETTLNYSLILTKEDTKRYNSFKILENNNIYELLAITTNIIDWESRFGNAPVDDYMMNYPDIKIEKIFVGSGDKIYIISQRDSENKFQFAVKSQVWPAGYA